MPTDSTMQLQTWIVQLHNGAGEARSRALKSLINHSYDRLRRLARTILPHGDRVRHYEDSGDVLHRAWPRIERALSHRPPSTVSEYFRTAAREIRRTVIDLARHYYGAEGDGQRRAVQLTDPGQDSLAVSALDRPDVSGEPSRVAQYREMLAAIDELPEEVRSAFDLLYVHDLTRAEAAAVLDVSEATVYRRSVEAKALLAERLGDDTLA